jgi:3-hydroxybutyryl-CoA dehydrogenase
VSAMRIAVIGAGTMGHGIAQVAAAAGHAVALVDTEAERVAAGLERIRSGLAEAVRRGKLAEAEAGAAAARVRGTTSLEEAAAGSALAIEAVPEELGLKARVLATLARHAPADALLASNTSSLSITALQREVPGPERVLGLHFFNPVPAMKLVEVVRGEATAEEVVARGVAFARGLGKEPIVVRDAPGFASSRLGVALGLEAMRMVEEGVATPRDIDTAMELGYRHPMGPLRLTDLVGLDVRLRIAEYLHRELGERFRPPEILRRLVAEGKLGQKSGAGFYTWEEE